MDEIGAEVPAGFDEEKRMLMTVMVFEYASEFNDEPVEVGWDF